MIIAYKLLRRRKDGTLSPLFFDTNLIVPLGVWLKSKALHKKGFAFRPGWHACATQNAPHLTERGREWCKVALKGVTKHLKPASQGGLWYTARQMKVIEEL